MNRFDGLPLPGLEFLLEGREEVVAPSRPYSATIAPTDETLMRFHARVVRSPGCHFFVGAVSGGDGYGRITWRRDGVSRTMSAHRFALLLEYGEHVAVAVGEHRCNEPLCVRVHPDHVIPSTQTANLRYAVSLGRAGGNRTISDGRSRVERSLAVREAVRHGWDPVAYAKATDEPDLSHTPPLF